MSVSSQHISRRLHAQALQAIEAKLALMARWVRQGIPVGTGPDGRPALEWYPTSLRTFCAWDGHQNGPAVRAAEPRLRRTAFQTLQGDPTWRADASTLLRQLEVTAEAGRRALDPNLAVADAQAQVTLERAKRAGALLGYRQARREAQAVRTALNDERRAHQQTIALLHAQEQELAQVRAQLAALTQTLRKTTPLKRVR